MSLNSPSYATVSTDQCTDSRHHVVADETPANASGCCPECDGVQLVSDDTETYCPDCGLIVEDAGLDHGPEWTPYDEAERRRVGGPVTPMRHDRGISAEIGRFRDGHGRELPAATQARLRRLRRWDRRARFESKADQNLAHGLGEIRRIGGALGVGESIQAGDGAVLPPPRRADTISSVATVPDGHVIALGGLITYFAYKAYRRTDSQALAALSVGFGIMTIGLLIAGAGNLLLGIDTLFSVLVESTLTTVALAVIVYSLYVR